MKKIKCLLLVIFIVVFSFCTWKCIRINKGIQKEKNEQEQLIEISEVKEDKEILEEEPKINFEELSQINSDIVAWITIDGTNINYPVVQTNNNTYYLKHSFYKKYSNYGTIYMDATANKDFSSLNTFIYGHYTSNQSMFGELGKYMNQEFFEDHPYILIYTPEKTLKAEIFSVHVDDASSPSYQMNFTIDEAYRNYIDLMKQKSVINSSVEIDYTTDKVITLYSCSRETNYKRQDRYYIHAVLQDL